MTGKIIYCKLLSTDAVSAAVDLASNMKNPPQPTYKIT